MDTFNGKTLDTIEIKDSADHINNWIGKESDTEDNKIMALKLIDLGYILHSDSEGFRVWHRNRFVGAGGTRWGRGKNDQMPKDERVMAIKYCFYKAVIVGYRDAVDRGMFG